jgi:flavodoxin/NAD-dependent dihydropyrimidine dehydrogenase PreA subunit
MKGEDAIVKGIVIYFSLTGNTRKVAYKIYQGMSRRLEQCHIAALNEVNAGELSRYDLIGLGSPVMWAVPFKVRVFIDKMPSLPGKHSFAFCTHGTMPEYFFPRIVRLLSRRGLTVIGTKNWYGSVSIPPFPKPYFTDGHPDEIDLREAEDFGTEIVELSRRISAGETSLIPPLPAMPPPVKLPVIVPSGMRLNMEKCRYPECHLCMDNCPWDAIDLSVSPPVFAKNCPTCCFCEMICPEGAIEADYEPTVSLHQYNLKNLLEPDLDKAEAEGSFRRLVPKEEIGWDTPYYQVYSQHPRYVIPIDNER